MTECEPEIQQKQTRIFHLGTLSNIVLRTFAPIATAHFFAHVTQTYCNAYAMHRRALR